MSGSWHQMIETFKGLGGIANNIEQRRGQFGNGIFPITGSKPVGISVPENLLVDVSDVFLADGILKIRPSDKHTSSDIAFLENYFNTFSWGADGRTGIEAFETALRSMPPEILHYLRKLGVLNLEKRHAGDWSNVILKRFMESRQINYHGRKVLMPIMELVNHSATMRGYTIAKGIQYGGIFSDEVFVNYSLTSDAFMRFLNYGFASPETVVYSLPLSMNLNSTQRIRIGLSPGDGQADAGFFLPKCQKTEKGLSISHLKLGSKNTPRLPKSIFQHLLSGYPKNVVDETFDRIRAVNLATYSELLGLMNRHEGAYMPEFRQAILHQLTAMSYCYGQRELSEFEPRSKSARLS